MNELGFITNSIIIDFSQFHCPLNGHTEKKIKYNKRFKLSYKTELGLFAGHITP